MTAPPEADPYTVLKLPQTAFTDSIKRTYRHLSLVRRPDKDTHNSGAHAAFCLVNESFSSTIHHLISSALCRVRTALVESAHLYEYSHAGQGLAQFGFCMRRQGWEDALGWLSDNCDFRPGLYSISCFLGWMFMLVKLCWLVKIVDVLEWVHF